jgi:hypothetical protein
MRAENLPGEQAFAEAPMRGKRGKIGRSCCRRFKQGSCKLRAAFFAKPKPLPALPYKNLINRIERKESK